MSDVLQYRIRIMWHILQCRSHISSMIHSNNMKCNLCSMCIVHLVTWLISVISYVVHICMYIPLYVLERYAIYDSYVEFSSQICLWHIYNNRVWNKCCSWLSFSSCKHQCYMYMPLQNEGSVTFYCNVVAMSGQFQVHMPMTLHVVCEVCVQFSWSYRWC